MREYQPISAKMEKSLYLRTLGFVRDYPRMRREADLLLIPDNMGINTDGQPRGSNTSDQVAEIAARRESILADIAAIEQAAALIPNEYRNVVLENVINRTPIKEIVEGDYAHRNTWSHYRGLFILYVAQNKGWA